MSPTVLSHQPTYPSSHPFILTLHHLSSLQLIHALYTTEPNPSIHCFLHPSNKASIYPSIHIGFYPFSIENICGSFLSKHFIFRGSIYPSICSSIYAFTMHLCHQQYQHISLCICPSIHSATHPSIFIIHNPPSIQSSIHLVFHPSIIHSTIHL